MQLIKLNEVMKITALSRATIYRYVAKGIFPAQISQGTHAVAWDLAEIEAWFQERIVQRNCLLAKKQSKKQKKKASVM